ncbi:hypothetical protein [Photobacterium sp. GSS17]|uniref:hypothetical protein n=1 Tax=Photobacterium TaxID=657 RepID=UPI00235E2873|nr:hypothetical protein [Photobacterium sp. GSS17]
MKERVLALCSSVMPGFYRLTVIFLISHFLTFNVEKNVNLFVFITGLCMFTSLGLSISLIKSTSGEKNTLLKNSVYFTHLSTLILISAAVIIIVSFFDFFELKEIGSVFLLLISLGCFQLERHFYLSDKNMKCLFYLDLLLIILTVCAFVIFGSENGINIISFSNVIIVLISWFFSKRFKKKNVDIVNKEVTLTGIKLGYSNLISSGVMYILPMLMLSVASEKLVSIFSMVVTISGIILVFPRAALNTKIQKLAEDARSGFVSKGYYQQSNKIIRNICIAAYPLSIIASVIYLFFNGINIFQVEPKMLIVIAVMLLMLLVGQLSLIDSMLIIFLNREMIALKYNTITFMSVIICYLIFSNLDLGGQFSIELMLIILSIILICYLVRFGIFRRNINFFVS